MAWVILTNTDEGTPVTFNTRYIVGYSAPEKEVPKGNEDAQCVVGVSGLFTKHHQEHFYYVEEPPHRVRTLIREAEDVQLTRNAHG